MTKEEYNKETGLLEQLRQEAGYEFLSDLSCSFGREPKRVIKAAEQIPPERYPLEEWTAAVCYITGKKRSFGSVEEAVSFLGIKRTTDS